MKIGIGVVSYNRPKDCTQVCRGIINTTQNYKNEFQYVCAVDQEDLTGYEWVQNKFEVISGPNKGVAGNKNRALHALKDNDVIFLFEDDLVPIKRGWLDLYAEALNETGMKHLNHSSLIHRDKLLKTIRFDKFTMCIYEKVAAQLMVFTKEVVHKVGAFDERYGKFGFEHADYTRRCKGARLCMPSQHDAHPFILESSLYFEELNIPRSLPQEEADKGIETAHKVYMDWDPKKIYIPFPKELS
jgi:hypothetical protein